VFITEHGPDLGKATFRTLCIKGVTLGPKLYDEPIPAQRILSVFQTQAFVVRNKLYELDDVSTCFVP
jgi:hypothetical protein